MKKSEMYRAAQGAVIECLEINMRCKLEILRELMSQEDLALFCEKQEEEAEKNA